jgi:hypothetical protein
MQEIGEDSVAFKFVYGYDTEDSVSTEHEDSFDIQVVRDGKEGKSPVVITVESTNGTVFKNGAIFTTLQCKVMQGEEDITDSATKFYWKKKLSDGTFDEDWNRSEEERTSSKIVITGTDIEERAIFICEVEL